MQTKPFVVEHKSSRRREHTGTQSIWAGVDLAKVAEDVADDLPAQEDSFQSGKVLSR